MTGSVLGVVASLAVLMVSGDQFVVGAAKSAAALRVRPSVVGAVVGGLGASVPELVVSSVASLRAESAIAVGNLVGSVIANVSLALALAAIIAPIHVDSRTVRREALVSVGSVLLFAVLLVGGLSVVEGVVLAVGLVLAVGVLLMNAGAAPQRDELTIEVRRFFGPPERGFPVGEAVRSLAGLGFMVLGAEVLVRSSSDLATRLGLGEGFVGLTVVAVGTTAPLVAICAQAARRGNHDLVVGSVLGSNLFIALAGGALVGLLRGGTGAELNAVPLVFMVAIVVAAWLFMARGSRLTRWEAGVLFVAYAATLPFVAT